MAVFNAPNKLPNHVRPADFMLGQQSPVHTKSCGRAESSCAVFVVHCLPKPHVHDEASAGLLCALAIQKVCCGRVQTRLRSAGYSMHQRLLCSTRCWWQIRTVLVHHRIGEANLSSLQEKPIRCRVGVHTACWLESV